MERKQVYTDGEWQGCHRDIEQMNIGLLLYDDDPNSTLAQRVKRAARRYRRKFGISANACYVHSSEFEGLSVAQILVGKIVVASLPNILLHHLWVGREAKCSE